MLLSIRMEFTLSSMSLWQYWNQDTIRLCGDQDVYDSGTELLIGYSLPIFSSLAGCMYPWLPTPVFHHYGHSAQFTYALSLAAMTLPLPSASCLLPPSSFSLYAFLLLLLAVNYSFSLPLRLKLPQRKALMGWASQHPVWASRGFEEFGCRSRKKTWPREAVTHIKLCWAALGHSCVRVEVPHSVRLSRGLWHRDHILEWEEDKGRLKGEGDWRGGLPVQVMSLSSTVGVSGSESCEGQEQLGVLWLQGSVLSMASRSWV